MTQRNAPMPRASLLAVALVPALILAACGASAAGSPQAAPTGAVGSLATTPRAIDQSRTPAPMQASTMAASGLPQDSPSSPPATLPAETLPLGTLPPGPAASLSASRTFPPSSVQTPFGTRFPGGLLIADRGNGRIVVIDQSGRILWQFPVPGSLPAGQRFAADDAFIAPDGMTIVANDETHQVIDRIDIATRRIVWQYGHYGQASGQSGYLHNPDDAYPLANGDIAVADIDNCRLLEIAPSKVVVHSLGRTGVCIDRAPFTYGTPNGNTPLPDGGWLITEIRGSRVVRLSASGSVVFDIHVPTRYPSDAQLDANGNVVVADYSNPGQVVCVSPTGHLIWRYAPQSGAGRLDHPSLATPLADGTVSINDDFRNRVVVIDPRTMHIVWQYGHTDVAGSGPGYLSMPDGHQPIPLGISF